MVQQIEVSLQLPVKQNTKCSYGKMDSLTERGHRCAGAVQPNQGGFDKSIKNFAWKREAERERERERE